MYRDLAETNLIVCDLLGSQGMDTRIVFDPSDRAEEMKNWLSSAYSYLAQKGKDLGERLTHAFHFAFDQGYERVIALGSDTLGLKTDFIFKGFEALRDHDVVIGPAADGGYYLIGLSDEQPLLFQDIPWSTSAVLKSTIARIEEEKLSFYCLQELEDLDEVKISTKER